MTTVEDVDAIYQHVGSRIGAARRRARMTQQDLADSIGLTRTSVVNIEKGRQKILVHTLLALSSTLKTSTSEILHGLGEVQDSPVSPTIKNYSPDVQQFILSGARLATKTMKKSKS